jgi:hypothetical protein
MGIKSKAKAKAKAKSKVSKPRKSETAKERVPLVVARMTDEELTAFVHGYCNGQVFTSSDAEACGNGRILPRRGLGPSTAALCS